MRVTGNVLANQALLAMQQAMSRIAKSQNRMATSRQVDSPADDPAAYAAATRLTARVAESVQYQRQVDGARPRLQAAGEVLDRVNELMARVQELAIGGSDGSKGAEERAGIGAEVNQLLEEIVSAANTESDGRYVFSGQETQTAPLTVVRDGSGHITSTSWPAGLGDPVDTDVAPGLSIRVTVKPQDAFGNDTDATFLPGVVIALRDALQSNDQNAVNALLDPLKAAGERLGVPTAEVGARLQALDTAQAAMARDETDSRAALSALTDADLGRVAIELGQQQVAYQAALAAAAKAVQPSLLEFLR
jgi:flagellar hook-associated protein 3 FlgL